MENLTQVYLACAKQLWAQMTADERTIAQDDGVFPVDLMETAIITLGFLEYPLWLALTTVAALHDKEML
jgi:hypothetical protein